MHRETILAAEDTLISQIVLHCLRRRELPYELQRHEPNLSMVIDAYKTDEVVSANVTLPPKGRDRSTRLQVEFTLDEKYNTMRNINCIIGDGEPSENWKFTLEIVDNQLVSRLIRAAA